MNEIQQLLASYNELEEEMIRFSTLVKEVMASITMQEFVPEKANTEMMQCIMELNTKQKECLKLYKQANLGDAAPKKMHIMRDQIEKRMNEARKLEYLEAVKKSFLSLYTEDADVEEKLQAFKDKVVTIKVEKYPLEQCLVYIRPFAVFLTMIKSDDPVKAIEQVPVLNEYFGSALVAHITISKDIFIGDDATEFNLEGEEASDLHKDSAVKKKNETVQSAGSKEDADTAKNVETKQEPEAQPVEEQAAPQEEELIAEEETAQEEAPAVEETSEEAEAAVMEEAEEEAAATDSAEDASAETTEEDTQEADEPAEAEQKEAPVAKSKRVHPDPKKPSKPRKAKKVDLKALLEEDNFKESKYDDEELHRMQQAERGGRKDKGDSKASFLKGFQ